MSKPQGPMPANSLSITYNKHKQTSSQCLTEFNLISLNYRPKSLVSKRSDAQQYEKASQRLCLFGFSNIKMLAN